MSIPSWEDIRRDSVWRSRKTGRPCTVMLDVAGIWDEVLFRTAAGRSLKRRVPVFLDQYEPEKAWLARQAEQAAILPRANYRLSSLRLRYRPGFRRRPGGPAD